MSDQQYDDTDKGVAFPPFPDQQLILQGKLNNRGNDTYVALIKGKTKGGTDIIEVYEKVGVLFKNKSDNEKAPQYSGPYNGDPSGERQLAGWKRQSNGKNFLSLAVSDKQQQSIEGTSKEDLNEAIDELEQDNIPF